MSYAVQSLRNPSYQTIKKSLGTTWNLEMFSPSLAVIEKNIQSIKMDGTVHGL